jgi:putative Mn2+ efflux pump MntP
MTMNVYIITWAVIVGFLILTFVFRIIENFRKECNDKEHNPHFFEISKEDELFYCPGDENLIDEPEYM